MRIRDWGIKGIAGLVVTLCLIAGLAQTAYAKPKGIDEKDGKGGEASKGYCTVYSHEWNHEMDTGLTLKTAAYFANSKNYSSCDKGIYLKTNVDLRGPLVIAAPSGFVFNGNGHELDARNIGASASKGYKSDGYGEPVTSVSSGNKIPCAIYVATQDVEIGDVAISAPASTSQANYNGVCLISSGADVRNVDISNGQIGIYIEEGSTGNRIMPDVEITSVDDYGIYDASKTSGTNRIVMTTQALKKDLDGDLVADDQNGILLWDDAYYTLNQLLGLEEDCEEENPDDCPDFSVDPSADNPLIRLTMDGVDRLFGSTSDLYPLITLAEEIGNSDIYKVEGVFVKADMQDSDDDGVLDEIDCSTITATSEKPQRLAVLMVGKLIKEGGGTEDGMVIGAIVDRGVKGIDNDTNEFDFRIDTKAYDGVFQDINKFVLVPVEATWEIMGNSSSFVLLSGGSQSDCSDPDDYEGGNGSGGGDMGVMEYLTLGECQDDVDYMDGYCNSDKDSDVDGIPDCIEMGTYWDDVANEYKYDFTTADCTCQGTVTCWYKIDTDYDGIPDGADNGQSTNWWDGLVGYDSKKNGPKTVTGIKNSDAAITGDHLPDMRDDDSDEDGLPDGHEDRTRTFQPYDHNGMPMTSYFKKFDTTGSGTTYYKDTKGDRVKCDLTEWEGGVENGIRWGIFRMGGDEGYFIDKPTEYTVKYMDGSTPDLDTAHGQRLAIMACVNDTVGGEQSFDGEHQKSNGETDARSPDTDGDCVCDWNGAGCKAIDGSISTHFSTSTEEKKCTTDVHGGDAMDPVTRPQWYNDRCPNKGHLTNDCSPECLAEEVLQAVAYNPLGRKWLKPHPTEDDEVLLQMRDDGVVGGIADNGTPDLFEITVTETDSDTGIEWTRPDYGIVYDACSDMDKDGIPDCLERWEPTCNPVSVSNFLDPYEEDSDFDGYVDGIGKGGKRADVCPFENEPGYDDAFTEVNPHYSCSNPLHLLGQGNAQAVLGCFMDRDGDEVIDCLEDRNMDGSIDSSSPTTNDDFSPIFSAESNPLDPDSDDDGLSDYVEVIEGWPYRTNPNRADTDNDGLNDAVEDHDGNGLIEDAMYEGQGCNIGLISDTDPRKPDTDGDTLNDGVEVDGPMISEDNFLLMIQDTTNWSSGGILHGSSPLAIDSDNDGLTDAEEYNGNVITYFDSNPCMMDSDGDSRKDNEEPRGCRLKASDNCVPLDDPDAAFGVDSDDDGLTDALEAMLGTNPNDPDTDGDEVWDGIEDANRNGIYESALGESNPTVADTDGDGLSDGFELRYGTDPTNTDTDGDCIQDGVEDENRNGQYDMGTETDARSSDTDSDGLPDGWVASSGLGEDIDCDGTRDTDEDGRYTETDPRNPDSDMDGIDDFTEMTHGGYFNLSNMNRSTSGREGCSLAGTAGSAPGGMMLLIGLALAAARLRRRDDTPA